MCVCGGGGGGEGRGERERGKESMSDCSNYDKHSEFCTRA